ncbi:unnamed protein product [Sphagnum balticum]
MISVKKSTESNGKHAFVVECRLLPLLDGKQQQHEDVTRTKKFMCKGWDDQDAQSKVLRFLMATDVVSAFREFLFNEPDGCAMARREGSIAVGATIARPDGVMPLGSSLGKIGFEETSKRKIRSFVCVRQKQACGLKYAVALCRTENGCLRSISFHAQASSVDKDGAVRSAEDQAVDRAVLFLRSVAFESWRKQGVGMEALQREREQAGAMIGSKHARERGLKHPCSFVEIEQGEKVDCSCGKNRSRGLMMACERCGAWEHAECKGYRNDKQIPADYVCSACERAQREEVIVIRLEEQPNLWSSQLEDLWTDEKIKEKEGDEPVCCVCGCEDNEDLEALIQACSCDAGSSVAHPNCVTAAINKASQRGHPTQGSELAICHICGDETGGIVTGAQNAVASKDMGSLNSNTRSSTRAMKADHSLRGTKRLRSALTNGALPAKGEIVEKRPAKSCKDETDGHVLQQTKPDTPVSDQGKLDVPLLGRRFSDAAATVPIKKRRIQLLDVVRSPSPPIRMASPRAHLETLTGNEGSEADAKPECAQNLEGAETVEVEQLVLKGPSIGEATVSEVGYCKQGLETERHQLKEDERDRVGDYHGRNFDDEEVVGACKVMTTGNIVGSKGKRVDAVLDMIKVVTEDSQVIKANDIDDDSVGKPKEKFKLVYRNRELNDYHMCDTSKFTRDESSEVVSAVNLQQPEVLTPVEGDTDACSGEGKDKVGGERELPTGGMSSRSRPSDTRDLALKLGQAVQEAVEGGEFSCSEPSIEGSYGDHRNGPLCKDLRADEEDSSTDVEKVGPSDDVSMEGRTMSDGERSPSSLHGRNSFSHKWEADAVEELDAEHVDYGDSDCRDGDELEADDSRQLSGTQAESKLEVVDSGEHDEALDRGSSEERNEITVNKEDRRVIKHEQKFVVKSEISGMRSEVIGRVKLSGWDQLPEGFDKAEDALRAAKEGSGRGGRGVPQWANHPGWGSCINNIRPMSSHIGPGPGRGSLVRNDPPLERARSDPTRSRDDRSYGRRVDDGFELSPRLSSHEIGHSRGRGGGSLDLSRGRGRPDPWFNSPSGPPTPWRMVPSGHLSPPGRFPEPGFSPRGSTNAAAVAAAKVESSGFIVAPDGTVIKVGSPAAGPIRGSPRSFGPGGRGGRRSSLFSMGGRGGGGLNMALPGVATMGPGDNMRGGGRGLGGRRSMSMGLSMGMGVGPGISANTSGRGALTRDRSFDRFSGPFSPQGVDPMTESPSGRPGSRYGDEWGHRDRTPSPPLSRHTRISPVRRPRSGSRPRSRSRSPRMHTSPKPLTSSIGGSVLPASPQPKKSHSPITNHNPLESKPDTWPKSHAEKPESPSRRLVPPPPKLPLPPPPPRNQRSPPAGLKRLSGKREVDQFRERGKDRDREKEQDWERERPVPRIRTPPLRTSPHVVHGSALMDERDLQLLAGIRNVSPAARHRRRNELSGSGPPSSQEQSPHSSRGRSADGASDLRRTTGDEPGERDRDTHGARREDFVAKGGERNLEALRSGNDIDSRDRRMGAGAWRDRGGQDDEALRAKDAHNHNSRDGGKNGGSSKYTSSREGDDDVAPRRRRPPP